MPDVNAPTLITNARVVTSASDYTIVGDETLVIITSTASARTVSLPSASLLPNGFSITVKDGSAGAGTNNITIDADGADTIDGTGNVKITTNSGAKMVQVADSANGKWAVISFSTVTLPIFVKKTTAGSSTYTLLDSDDVVWSTYTATGTQTITLPLASSITIPTGFIRVFTIFDAGGNAGTNNITVARSGSDTINGATSFTINGNYESRQFATDGSTWFLY